MTVISEYHDTECEFSFIAAEPENKEPDENPAPFSIQCPMKNQDRK